jgi:hypothetical protein
MSAAFFVEGGIVEGDDEGRYTKMHRTFEAALADFMRLLPYAEDLELRYSS